MFHYNSFRVLEDEHYLHFLAVLKSLGDDRRRRGPADGPPPLALVTVSNHSSTIDDPAIFGAMLPALSSFNPDEMRWSLCSQEICFKNMFSAAFFGVR